jgi:hypothetical protein
MRLFGEVMLSSNHNKYNVLSPAPRDAWEEILRQDPNALVYQTPAWTDAAVSTGQFTDESRLYETPDGRCWLLPMLHSNKSILGLSEQSSVPSGWGQGGLLSNQPLTPEDVQWINSDLAGQPVMRTLISPNPLLASVWEQGMPSSVAAVPRISHILDLEGGFEKVWSERIESKTRTAIRKAERSDLTVDWDATGKYIPIFYEMFEQWALRRGRERHIPARVALWSNRRRDPLQRFESIASHLGEACRVYIAWLDSQPVAASILLMYQENAFTYRSTSIRELAHPVRANDLVQSQMIQDTCAAGCRHLYRGESGGVASLMRFKSGFGAEPVAFKDYSIERLPFTAVSRQVNRVVKRGEKLLIHGE